MSDPVGTLLATSGTVSDELLASLAIERIPVFGPTDCVLHVTLKVVLCPAAIVKGRFKPLTANLGLDTSTRETVTLEAPELVMVSDRV